MIGILASPKLRSPMKESSKLRPFGHNFKKSISTALMLTSLVDAFTIVVIYLIVNSSDGEQIDLKEGIELPQASFSQQIDQSPVVVYKDNQFYIDDKAIPSNQLQSRLHELHEKTKGLFKTGESAIIVQADQNIEFDKMQPLMVASAYAGIKQVKFAVFQKD